MRRASTFTASAETETHDSSISAISIFLPISEVDFKKAFQGISKISFLVTIHRRWLIYGGYSYKSYLLLSNFLDCSDGENNLKGPECI